MSRPSTISAYFEDFGSGVFGLFGSILGVWGLFWPFLAHFGSVLGLFRVILGLFWACFGGPRLDLGPFLALFWLLELDLAHIWAIYSPFLGVPGWI